jgi:hypothetical protein
MVNNPKIQIIKILFLFYIEPGVIEFEEPITLVKESIGKAEIKVVRANGADGRVSVHYRTKDMDAVATRDYERKYLILFIKNN